MSEDVDITPQNIGKAIGALIALTLKGFAVGVGLLWANAMFAWAGWRHW